MSEILQESPRLKAEWLEATMVRFPIGMRVRVVGGDVSEYVGATGTVIDYDVGDKGLWPIVSVRFDAPIACAGSSTPSERDGFYGDGDADDEIVPCGGES